LEKLVEFAVAVLFAWAITPFVGDFFRLIPYIGDYFLTIGELPIFLVTIWLFYRFVLVRILTKK